MLKLARLFRTVTIARKLCNISDDDMAKGKFFYAVRKGFSPGVYHSWDECKAQVFKFPSAIYKKFVSEKDAWAFVRGSEQSLAVQPPTATEAEVYALPKKGPEPLEYIPLGNKRSHVERRQDDEAAVPSKRLKRDRDSSADGADGFTYMGDAVTVYTDGCCSSNGKRGARAGIGVYWGPGHPLNVAEPLQGRQTNQRAEIQAACRALRQAKEQKIKKLVVYTDSKFTINGVTKWVKNWKLNGWQLKSGAPVINREDFETLDRLNQELEVVWIHIPGHAGYRGNEEADRLSREGAAKLSRC
ncbi:ribonuclease H1 [Corythoichthys intestinalis]|uniref:ribonuclease H1 n=1 Tax=Corythoichthys intestinalis TaxID=161448 RepID=UPI0025A4DBDE|nr:ribonuclease H1 [Corythoichthys intestinalis]XP_061806308.1 ribonuclease H1-like [Nerophis lumbriciformis]